jgi:ADP-ribosylglycohydrolase
MKICIIGIISDDIEQVIQNTINICKVTHNSMLVIVSCLVITLLVHLSKYNNFLDKSYNPLIDILKKIKNYLDELSKDELEDFYRYINVKNLSDINLDEDFKVSYTLKCMACVIWSIKNINFGYNNILKEIYSYGGDTDTNGCVVGGVIGFILGKSSINYNWINNIKHQDFINYNSPNSLMLIK